MLPAEILSKAKEHIKGAYAVRQMRSHDTEVFVQSARQRDAALNMPHPETFKILRQDYPVEVPGVPLSTKIEGGKNANNNGLITKIIEGSIIRIPGLQINRIRWLHDGREVTNSQTNGHKRGSIIVSLPTEALQAEVVRNGLVLDSMLFSAHLWSPKGHVKQCFNCNQWGHTQALCRKEARCGECAGSHQTKDCPKKGVSCCNCGKSHRAWQKNACHTFQIYKNGVENFRKYLLEKTAEIRKEGPSSILRSSDADITIDPSFTLVTRNKDDEPRRGRGRPRKVTQSQDPTAATDRSRRL